MQSSVRRILSPTRRRLRAGLIAIILLLLPVVFVAGHFRLTDEAAVMRRTLRASMPEDWHSTVELNLGPGTMTLLRAGLRWIKLPPEARAFTHATRELQFGIYQSASAQRPDGTSGALAELDRVMVRRGWNRLLGVAHDDVRVGIYVQEESDDRGPLEIHVLVMANDRMVLASGRIALEALVPLVEEHLDTDYAAAGRMKIPEGGMSRLPRPE